LGVDNETGHVFHRAGSLEMNEMSKIVEGIRECILSAEISGRGQDGEDSAQVFGDYHRLQALAEDYARGCHDINERAYQCQELLNCGQRPKAMLLAKRTPDLRKQIEGAAFREQGQWLEVCERLELPFPVIIDTDVVTAVIEDVYDHKRAIDDLLCLHRRMAMGVAPLQDRLRIVRKLCKADPKTTFWREDVIVYERARVEELLHSAEEGDKKGDLSAIDAVYSELGSGQWFHPPSASLIKAIGDMRIPHCKRLAREQYTLLAADIHQAHGAMNEDRCEGLMAQWRAVKDQMGFGPDSALLDQIAPTTAWLADLREARDEERAYEDACAHLTMAIDDGERRDRLEKLAADVLRFGRGMEQLLAARLNSQIENLGRLAKRRFALRLVGVIAAMILIAAGITVGVQRYAHAKEISRWHERVSAVMEKGDVAGALKMLAMLEKDSPSVSRAPEIVALRSECIDIIDREKRRREEFEHCMAAVDKAGVAEPDKEALARADKLASGFDEKNQIQDWREKIQTYKDDKAREVKLKVEEQMTQLESLYAVVTEADASDLVDLTAKADKCVAHCEKTKGMDGIWPAASNRANAIGKATRELVAKARKDVEEEQAVKSDLIRIVRASRTPATLALVLKQFGKDHPSHPSSAQFVRAAAMAHQWAAVTEWNRLAKVWAIKPQVDSTDEGTSREEKIKEYLNTYADGPYAKAARAYNSYLSAVDTALPGGQLRGLRTIERALGSTLISNVNVVRTKAGAKYYRTADALKPKISYDTARQPYSYTFEYITDLDLSTNLVKLYAKNLDLKDGFKSMPAPQVALHSVLSARIARFKGSGWETFYLNLASTTAQYEDVDPILKAIIMKGFLGRAAETSPFVKKEISDCVTMLEDLYLDDVVWVEPRNAEANRKRKTAGSTVKRLMPVIENLVKFIKGGIVQRSGAHVPYTPVGVILGIPDDVRFPEPLDSGTLHVLRKGDAEAAAFMQIGVVSAGKAKFTHLASSRCPVGSIVYRKKDK